MMLSAKEKNKADSGDRKGRGKGSNFKVLREHLSGNVGKTVPDAVISCSSKASQRLGFESILKAMTFFFYV